MIRAIVLAATVAILSVMYLEQPTPKAEPVAVPYCLVADPYDPRKFAMCSEVFEYEAHI